MRRDINSLKGLAIIAVVLYHMGISDNGYLGVDVFFVIAGYFTAHTLFRNQAGDVCNICLFLFKRCLRLLPLLLCAEIVCMVLGHFLMLPDDYENLSSAAIATSFFSNNILACITTHNYWNVTNAFRPLMHTWYVGVLMQFYIACALLYFVSSCFFKKMGTRYNKFFFLVFSLSIISLVLLFISDKDDEKFYYLPYRFFEFGLGCVALYLINNNVFSRKHITDAISLLAVLSIVILLFSGINTIGGDEKILFVVASTIILLLSLPAQNTYISRLYTFPVLAVIGLGSYSIFVWHQIVLAFMRYSFTDDFNIVAFCSVLLIVSVLSFLSFKYIEKIKFNRNKLMLSAIMFLLINAYSLFVYYNAGVVRDVPELDVIYGKQQRGMHSAYVDRIYQYDKNFTASDRPHWLIIGNSFGRDWANVILESCLRDKVEISYLTENFIYDKTGMCPSIRKRINSADIVFYSTLGESIESIEYLKTLIPDTTRFYIVGEKNFGISNGLVYRKRFDADYYNSCVTIESEYIDRNSIIKKKYYSHFIDLLSIVSVDEGKVRVFTDDKKYISQDCRHFTMAGARYIASRITWTELYNQ